MSFYRSYRVFKEVLVREKTDRKRKGKGMNFFFLRERKIDERKVTCMVR